MRNHLKDPYFDTRENASGGSPTTIKSMTDTTSYRGDLAKAQEAARAYYAEGRLLMADIEYDALIARIAAFEAAHPEQIIAHDLLTQVAGGTAKGTVAHAAPMLSLDNCFDAMDLRSWLDTRTGPFTTEPKFDGLSLGAAYRNGKLVRIATRGDGTHGEDVTYAASRINGLPAQLTDAIDVEVRGEVIFTAEHYEAANDARMAAGKPAFVNPRNAAAGTLRTETLEYAATLTFFAHGHSGLENITTHSEAMARLNDLGVNTGNGDLALVRHADCASVLAAVERFGSVRGELEVDVDGMVIKIDSIDEANALGHSSRAPRWAIAFKYPAVEATSVLRSVEWTVGRTGRITPRATIDPVFVAGTTVTFATLHNAEDIKRKDLRIGDTVLVKRAGEVIPRIEAPIVEKRDGSETIIQAPSTCPRCNGQINKDDKVWRCQAGRACGAAEAIRYAASRDCLDIEGMGDKLVEQLVKTGTVKDVADLFMLTTAQLAGLERMGDTSAAKVIEQINNAKTQPLSRVFCALGVRMTGRSMSRRLARHFATMSAITGATQDDLCAVDGVGPERAATIAAELVDLADVIARMEAAGVNMNEPVNGTVENGDSTIAGKTFVVTGAMSGRLEGLSRNDVHARIEAAGGKTSGSVSKKTDYLVTGEAGGSKVEKAQALGVKTISPDELAALLDA